MLESVESSPIPPPIASTGHGRILASAAMLGGATVLVKLVAFVKDLLVADVLGAGDELDAFLVAFLFPSFGVTVLATSLAPALMPTYVRLLERQGRAAAGRLAAAALAANCGLATALAVVLVALGPLVLPWIALGFDGPKLALVQSLLYLMAGVLVASSLSAVFSTLLNANDHFAMSAAAPLMVPAATLALFWSLSDRLGVFALAAGTLAGFILECLVLGYATLRHRLLPWPTWHAGDEHLRHVAARYAPVALGSLLLSASVIVDQSMAASLGSGNVSVLNYGNKIVSLLLGVVAVSLSTVLFPRFSRMVAQDQWKRIRRTVRDYAVIILVASVPCVAVVALWAEPMIRLLFERGAFTPEATRSASQVQAWLALQIPFYVLAMIGFRVLSALDGNHLILRIAALNLAVNVVGDLVLMRWFGVAGIAMSTSLVWLVGAIATFAAIRARMAESRGK